MNREHRLHIKLADRSVGARFGSQGSVIDWLLRPRLAEIRKTLGSAMVELEQMRSADVVRAVADAALWKGRFSPEARIQDAPVADLLPRGQFNERWLPWLTKEAIVPKGFARMSSFIDLTEIVQASHAAAVLPDMAEVDFDSKRYAHVSIPALRNRTLALVANGRSLDRSGVAPNTAAKTADLL